MKKSKSLEYLVSIVVLIGIFALIFSRLLAKPVSNLDELWNYNTARQIMNGLIPYKDISMITTPLFSAVTAVVLKLTSDELIIFRIITAVVSTAIIFMTYLIFKQLTKNRGTSFALSGIILYIYYKNFMLDYNFVVLLITLIIEYLELKRIQKIPLINDKNEIIKYSDENINSSKTIIDRENVNLAIIKDNRYNFIIGILAGLAICTKQTVGAFVFIGTLITELIFVSNKENFKQYIKNAVVRTIGMLIPFIILLVYLIITGALKDFIGYAILGIKTFSNSISYKGLIKSEDILIRTLSIILPIFLMLILVAQILSAISKKRKTPIHILSKIEIMTVYSLVMLIVLYPISDKTHFLIAILPLLIEFLYVTFEILKKLCNKIKLKIMKHIILIGKTAIILAVVTLGIKCTYVELNKYISDDNKNTKLEHYKNIIVPTYIINRINEINNLIIDAKKREIDVIILDAEATVINIPLNRYCKNYDMFLKGNIGKDGEQGIINDIEQSTNCVYLTKKDKKNLNWQTPKEVINYVEENLEKIGEVTLFNVYYKK